MGYDAQVVCDSAANGVRLTTMVVTFPRIVLAEWNTHRMFSRNSASSRAIPVERRIAQIEAEPFVPSAFALNKAGMQAGDALDAEQAALARACWISARNQAVMHARDMVKLGVHKQWANRLIETFAWHTVVVSFTEIQNYWNLRDNPKAQPEIMTVTGLMREAYAKSTPRELKPGEWHLPFVTQPEIVSLPIEVCVQLSVARAAAVSYERHMLQDFDKDIARYASLLASGHMSPFEHPAKVATVADLLSPEISRFVPSGFLGNFALPWIQHRKTIPGEAVFFDPDLQEAA